MNKLVRMTAVAVLMAPGFVIGTAQAGGAPDKLQVLETYADIAHATYEDSLITAQNLQGAIGVFLDSPTQSGLENARAAWIAARAPYQQSEAYRFGNPVVDDWEGKVNAWPLDEGLIDYVDTGSYGAESDENMFYTVNVIANEKITLSGRMIDTATISKSLLAETLHEVDEVEANVATGYHAIEFLLWGQDLNGTGPGAGARPATDFDIGNCTGGNCERRRTYLSVATDLLIDELNYIVAQWAPGGAARAELLAGGADAGLTRIITGMGSLSYGELAGERMKLGLMLHDPEEEHDCFSDNTHASHFNDALGIKNVYTGTYARIDGSSVSGPSLSALVETTSPALDKDLRASLDATLAKMQVIVDMAAQGTSYDQLIGEGNAEGNQIVQAAIDALAAQTGVIERVVASLALKSIEFEGSDSLDNPSAVFE